MTLLWGQPHDHPAHDHLGDRPRRLLLARHGATDWNAAGRWQGHRDIPLNALGRAQARALADRLAGETIDALWTSDLSRARETAEAVARRVGREAVVSALLREIDVGLWEGLSSAEIARSEPDVAAALARGEDVPRGGAEQVAAFHARVVRGFEGAAATCPDGTLLLVVHGGVIKMLVAHLLGLPLANAGRLTSGGNAGLSEVRFGPSGPQLVRLNDTAHVEAMAGRPPVDSA